MSLNSRCNQRTDEDESELPGKAFSEHDCGRNLNIIHLVTVCPTKGGLNLIKVDYIYIIEK